MLFFVKTLQKHFTKTKQKSIKNASSTILPLKNNIIIQTCVNLRDNIILSKIYCLLQSEKPFNQLEIS